MCVLPFFLCGGGWKTKERKHEEPWYLSACRCSCWIAITHEMDFPCKLLMKDKSEGQRKRWPCRFLAAFAKFFVWLKFVFVWHLFVSICRVCHELKGPNFKYIVLHRYVALDTEDGEGKCSTGVCLSMGDGVGKGAPFTDLNTTYSDPSILGSPHIPLLYRGAS